MAESILFNVGIQTQQYEKGVKRIQTKNNQLMQGVKRLGATLLTAFAGRELLRGINTVTTAFNKQQSAEKRLESITKSVTGATNEQINALKSLAAERQRVGVIGDEVSISGMSQLATFQLQTNSIRQLTPALQTMAVAQYGVNVSQEQIINTANQLGRAFMGFDGALTRVNKTALDKSDELLETLSAAA